MSAVSQVRAAGPWTHRDVHARGVSFHVVIAGDEPDRPTVFLLHDFPLNWWSWREQIKVLSNAGFRVIAMDLRGMGGSDLQPDSVELLDLAEDVVAVANATGTPSYTLVGTGVGGAVAWTVAHLAPAELRSVVTFAAPHPLSRVGRESSDGIRIPLSRKHRLRNGSLVETMLTSWCGPSHVNHMSGLAEQYASPLRRVFAANAALEVEQASRKPSSASKKVLEGHVQVPVWSVQGMQDGHVPPSSYVEDSALSGQVVLHLEITESGHFPNEEEPEAVSRILLDHMATMYPERGGLRSHG